MRPERIILVRHGQSLGNVDRTVYERIPDYALPLTDIGMAQAYQAGVKLADYVGQSSIKFYGSSYWRTRQTYQIAKTGLTDTLIKRYNKDNWNQSTFYLPWDYYEDPRLTEQSWGHCQSVKYNQEAEDARDAYGSFYYQFKDGESCVDVFIRASSFLDTLFRDFKKENYPRNAVIFTHGMKMRVLLMRFFHYSVEQFETIKNPPNCGMFVLEQMDNGKYKLETEPQHWPEPTHPYQYNWNEFSHWRPNV